MHRLSNFLSITETMLSTKRKRHIIGGVLLSIALLFGGLAFTVTTINEKSIIEEEEEYGREIY